MVIPGIIVPFIPPMYHRGLFDGISYMMMDGNTFMRAVLILLLMAAPYLLIALLQHAECSVRGTRHLLLLNIGIATIQLIVYFEFYDTFVMGLFVWAFPVLTLPAILIVTVIASKQNNEL
jgi:hypothetical protein